MQEQGDDLAASRDIDFFVIFAARAPAEAFAVAATAALGLPAQVLPYENTLKWQTVLTRHMLPDRALLNSLEKQIVGLACQHGGDADGWGCLPVNGKQGLR